MGSEEKRKATNPYRDTQTMKMNPEEKINIVNRFSGMKMVLNLWEVILRVLNHFPLSTLEGFLREFFL